MYMDSSDEYENDLEKSKPRLNMSHGFIHHIRRNQIDRDNYDKKVKSQPKQYNRRSRGNKKPESKLYVPPSRSEFTKNDDDEEGKEASSSQKSGGKPLFRLEYTAPDGIVHPVVINFSILCIDECSKRCETGNFEVYQAKALQVRQGQDASKIARRLANQAAIPAELLNTLKWKIEQEQAKRS